MLAQTAQQGMKMFIFASINNKKKKFTTKIVHIDESGVYADIIVRKGKRLNFKVDGMELKIRLLPEEGFLLYEYRDVKIDNVRLPDGRVVHKLISDKPGRRINRRGAVRVDLDIPGSIQAKDRKEYITIRDISNSGVGFISEEEWEIGTLGSIDFQEDRFHFTLNGEIVRVEKLDDVRSVYGFRMFRGNINLEKYITGKQRYKLKRLPKK